MRKINLYIGSSAPSVNNGAAWLKPVDGGFALYVLDNGLKPLKLVDDKGTHSEGDDTVEDVKTELIGSAQDDPSANTINGAKAAGNSYAAAVLGKDTDTSSDMTLHGLKAYIDEQIEALG